MNNQTSLKIVAPTDLAKWHSLRGRGAQPIGVVFRMPDGSIGAVTEAGRVTWNQELAAPEEKPHER